MLVICTRVVQDVAVDMRNRLVTFTLTNTGWMRRAVLRQQGMEG
jgi:hypothetical protein